MAWTHAGQKRQELLTGRHVKTHDQAQQLLSMESRMTQMLVDANNAMACIVLASAQWELTTEAAAALVLKLLACTQGNI